jgi:amidohydrolase
MNPHPQDLFPVHDRIRLDFDRYRERILAVNDELFRHPELSEKEFRSSRFLVDLLGAEGFQVQSGLGGLPTAFRAVHGGSAGPRIAFLAEYDALPGIGHGCGHNLIAAAAVGAALCVKSLVTERGGEIQVIGTPAEETIGGKVILAEAGVFDDLDAALMIHPAGENRVFTESLAAATFQVEFHGRAAHAVVHPEKGINALDALVELYRAAPGLAREIGDGARLPGVIRAGGERPNVVPDRAVGLFSLRARGRNGLERLLERFRGRAAEIAGRRRCGLHFRQVGGTYREMRTNRGLAIAFKKNLKILGIKTVDKPRTRMGSLDMGNVSQVVPAVHPFLDLGRPGLASHTEEFARATVDGGGREALIVGVRALAMTAADLVVDRSLRERIRAEHDTIAGGK